MAGALAAVLLGAAFSLLWGTETNAARRNLLSDKFAGSGVRPAPGTSRLRRAGLADPAGAAPGIADPALMLDLTAAMLEAGQPLLQALGILSDVVDPGTSACLRRVQAALELGAPWAAAWDLAAPNPGAVTTPAADLRDALKFVATTGAPSAAVLLAEAAQIRRRRSREAERRAAALGVRLVVPLGLCALPAFVVLTVVPLLLSLLPALP